MGVNPHTIILFVAVYPFMWILETACLVLFKKKQNKTQSPKLYTLGPMGHREQFWENIWKAPLFSQKQSKLPLSTKRWAKHMLFHEPAFR